MLPMLWKSRDTWPFTGEFDRMLEDWFPSPMLTTPWFGNGENAFPPIDVRETDDAYVVETELPGFKPHEFEVKLVDGVLTVSGERKKEKDEKTKAFHRTERYYGRMERQVALPADVEEEKIEAVYKDGLLQMTVPKKVGSKPKTVNVKVK